MSIEDKIFKAQQKADALTDSFTDNDPILARSEALKNKLVFDQLAKMSNPRVSLVDKLYSMGETQQRIQGIEEQEKAYKINKIADPTRYDNSYVDQKTGEVKKYSDLINYDREIEDYSLWGATKTAATRGTAELLQGTGKGLQWLTNQTGKGLETAGTLLGDITNSLLTGEKIYADKYNEINKKWDNNTIGALGVANAIAKPLNEAAKKINYKNLSSTDDIHQAFSEGLLEGGKELGSAIAHTLIGSAPEVAPALFGVVPGLVAGAGSFMARVDKERQAKALGVSPDDIMEVSPNMTPEDLIGGAIYGGLNLIDAGILKNAIGKGMISKLSDDTIGLSSKADNATKNAFAKLRESNPSLDAWLKPEGVGAKALAWTGDKAWKLGKTTGKVGGKIGIAAGLEGGAEMGQTLMEQWANGDLKDRSWDKNWEDIKEAGLMGAYVGGALKAPHAVYQEGKEVLNDSGVIDKLADKTLKKHTDKILQTAEIATTGSNHIFKELETSDYVNNISEEELKQKIEFFNGISKDIDENESIKDIEEAFKDKEFYDDVVKTIYLAKSGKLGTEAAAIVGASRQNLLKAIESSKSSNVDIMKGKSTLEKTMYAINLRDASFIKEAFISLDKNTKLNSTENFNNQSSEWKTNRIKEVENIKNTLINGLNATANYFKNSEAQTKVMTSLVNRIAEHAKISPVSNSVIFSGYKGKYNNEEPSIFNYVANLSNLSGKELINSKDKLNTFITSQKNKQKMYENAIKGLNNILSKGNLPNEQFHVIVPKYGDINPIFISKSINTDIYNKLKEETEKAGFKFISEYLKDNTNYHGFTVNGNTLDNVNQALRSAIKTKKEIDEEIDIAKDVVKLYENKIERDTRVNSNKNNDLKSIKDIEQDIASEDTDGVTDLKTESKEIKKDDKVKTQSKDIENKKDAKSNEVKSKTKPEPESKQIQENTISSNNKITPVNNITENTDTNINKNIQSTQNEEVTPSFNVEQEVNQEISNTFQNDLLNSIAEKNSNIENKTKELLNDTSIPWSKKSLDTIKNYIFDLSKKLSINETKSSFVDNSVLEIKKDINSFLETFTNKTDLLDRLEYNFKTIYKSITKYLHYKNNKLQDTNFGVFIQGDRQIIRTNPALEMLTNDNVKASMMFRAIEALINLNTSKTYMSQQEMQEELKTTFKNAEIKPYISGKILYTLNNGVFEKDVTREIGKSVLKDLGLSFKTNETSEEQKSIIEKELGEYVLKALENLSLVTTNKIPRNEIFNDNGSSGETLNIVSINEKVEFFKKDNEDTIGVAFKGLNELITKFNVDKTIDKVSYKDTPFGEIKGNIAKNTHGQENNYPDEVIKSLNVSRNTKYVSKASKFILDFFDKNKISDQMLNEASHGYTKNLNSEDILFSQIDSKKGKNQGIENENAKMLETLRLLANDTENKGIYFDMRISENGREFIQSIGTNPQSHKVARFLIIPEKMYSEYSKGENGEILGNNGKENEIAYQHLAQAFGFSTDKKARSKSIELGKAITKLNWDKLQEAFAHSIKNPNNSKLYSPDPEFNSQLEKLYLNIKELGHALSAMNALNDFHNAKIGEKFTTAILGEADGINNGIAIKLLQYMLDPSYVKLLESTGIDFFNQASDAISDYFAGKDNAGQKIEDLYKVIARKFSNSLQETIGESNSNERTNFINSIIDKISLVDTDTNKDFVNFVVEELNTAFELEKTESGLEVSKKARDSMKPSTQVFAYGAGDTSQLNNLCNAIITKLEEKALAFIKAYEAKRKGEKYNEKDLLNNHNAFKILRRICDFIGQDPNSIKNLLLKGVPNSNNYNTELLFTKFTRFKDVGSLLNGYNTIREILEITAKQMLVNTMSDTFTGIREQSNLVNQSVNNRLDLIQKHFELLKEQELKNSNKDFLTIKDIKKIENILKEYYPSINISIANEHERTNNKNKKEFVKKFSKTNMSIQNTQIAWSSDASTTINPETTSYMDNGAGTNVVSIHQKDGSTIMITASQTAIDGQRQFIGVHDATVVDANNAILIQNMMNKNSYELDMQSTTLKEFLDIAKQNITYAETILLKGKTFNNKKDRDVSRLTPNFYKAQYNLQKIYFMLSEFNKNVLSHYNVSYNNIQNGNKGSAYQYEVKDDVSLKDIPFSDTMINLIKTPDFITVLDQYKDLERQYLFNGKQKYNKKTRTFENKSEEELLEEDNTFLEDINDLNAKFENIINNIDNRAKAISSKYNIHNPLDESVVEEVEKELTENEQYLQNEVMPKVSKVLNGRNVNLKEVFKEALDKTSYKEILDSLQNELANFKDKTKADKFKKLVYQAMDLKEDFDQEVDLDNEYIDNEITNPIFNQEVKDQINNTKLNSPENNSNKAQNEAKEFYPGMVKEISNEDGSYKNSMTLVPEIKALQDDLQHSKAATSNNYNKNNLNSAEEFENTIEILSTETLADNIFNNVDEVLNIQQDMRNKDKYGDNPQNSTPINQETSEEHSKEMSNLLKHVMSPIVDSLGDLEVIYQTTNDNKNTADYDFETNQIMIRSASKNDFNGFMSREESFVHEIMHAISHFAVRLFGGNNPLTTQLRKAHRLFLENSSVEQIADKLNLGSREENLRVANLLYNHMTAHEDSLTNLEEFLTIGTTSQPIVEILKSIQVKEEKRNKSIYEVIVDTLLNTWDRIFGNAVKNVKTNSNLYDMLVSIGKEMALINQKAKNEGNKTKNKTLEIANQIRETLDDKGASIIKGVLNKVKEPLEKSMMNNLFKTNGKIPRWKAYKEWGTDAVLAMLSKKYREQFTTLLDMYPILGYDTAVGSIIDDLSTPNAMARIAQRFHRESSRIDAKRNTIEESTSTRLREYFKESLTKQQSQILGEVVLDTDLVSLNMDSNELIRILNDGRELQKELLTKKAELLSLVKANKNKLKPSRIKEEEYINFLLSKSSSLAYYMVHNDINDVSTIMNAYNIASFIGTGRMVDPDPNLVKVLDQYISLKALEMTSQDMKQEVANIIRKDTNAFNNIMTFIENYKDLSHTELFNSNYTQQIKGYRIDNFTNRKEIVFANIRDIDKYEKNCYKTMTNVLPINEQDNLSSQRVLMMNYGIETKSNFNSTAIRYTNGGSRGTDIKEIMQKEIFENPENIDEIKKEYENTVKKMMVLYKKSIDYSLKTGKILNVTTALKPIYDENGNISSFSYIMNKNNKKDLLGLDTDIFDALAKMNSSLYDKVSSKNINRKIADVLIQDYNNASQVDRDYYFMELSLDSKNEEYREIYKMLDYETRTTLENTMGGKIYIRKNVFRRFFGVRDMDVRNAKWFKNITYPQMKQAILFSVDLFRLITKLFKFETVTRTPGVFISNAVSNIFECMNHGISFTDTIKLHKEAIGNLKRYQELKLKLIKMDIDKQAGINISPALEKAIKDELKNNPVYPLIKAGFLNTIAEDLTPKPSGYLETKLYEKYDSMNSLTKKATDWAFLTNSTWLGSILTNYVHHADFLSRYAKYYGLKKQNKYKENEIIDIVSDSFIDYDAPTSKGIKALNDYGLVLFSRFFTRSQRIIRDHLMQRPFTTLCTLGARFSANTVTDGIADEYMSMVIDTNPFAKNYGYSINIWNPMYNAIETLTPSVTNFTPWDTQVNRNKSVMDNIF